MGKFPEDGKKKKEPEIKIKSKTVVHHVKYLLEKRRKLSRMHARMFAGVPRRKKLLV